MSVQPNSTVGECKVFKVPSTEINNPNLKYIVSKYSHYFKGKPITNVNNIASGAFGKVSSITIDGVEYALKEQRVTNDRVLKEMETEVSISNIIKDTRRKDGQRICVPIFECFFLCRIDVQGNTCSGKMVYIMEKGDDSVLKLIIGRKGMLSNYMVKASLLRDTMVKMMENISLLIKTYNLVNWDIKPGNSIYNFKKMTDTNIVQINPILIDIDDKFCETDFSKLINVDKLNYILTRLNFEGNPVRTSPLTHEDIQQLFIFIFQISYIHHSMDLLVEIKKHIQKQEYNNLLAVPFFTQKQTGEELVPLDILEVLLNPTIDNLWLNISFQLYLGHFFVDHKITGSKTYKLRSMFYHYNTYKLVGDISKKFKNFMERIQLYYLISRRYLKKSDTFMDYTFLERDLLDDIKVLSERYDNPPSSTARGRPQPPPSSATRGRPQPPPSSATRGRPQPPSSGGRGIQLQPSAASSSFSFEEISNPNI